MSFISKYSNVYPKNKGILVSNLSVFIKFRKFNTETIL